jgi:hypothetical protein
MEEKISDIIFSGIAVEQYDNEFKADVLLTSIKITTMITEFIEWAATTHIKLHQVWCGLYKDQRNQANWKTTEELFQFWNTNIRNK